MRVSGRPYQLSKADKGLGLFVPKVAYDRARGIDVSYYQVNIDLPTDAEVDFVIQRISYAGKLDRALETLYKDLERVSIKMGYHYFSTALPWTQQVDVYLGGVDGKEILAHWLDYEIYFNSLGAGSARDAGLWIAQVERETQQPTGLYTGPSVYKTYLQPYVEWCKTVKLWIAQYWLNWAWGKNPGMKDMNRTSWNFYQLTDQGNPDDYGVHAGTVDDGEYLVPAGGMDLNEFNGNYVALLDWLGISAPEEPPRRNVRREQPKPL